METFEIGLSLFLHYTMARILQGPRNRICKILNRNGLHRCMCLKTWPNGNGIIRRCDRVGVDMALFKEMCHCRAGFQVSYAQAMPSVIHSVLVLPADRDVESSPHSLAPCL